MSAESRTDVAGRIADQHDELRASLSEVEAELDALGARPPEARDTARLRELLATLRADMKAHFLTEERGGLFTSARDQPPHIRRRVDELILQHRRFEDQIGRIIEGLDGGDRELAETDADVRSLFTNIRWHDAVETGLLPRLVGERTG